MVVFSVFFFSTATREMNYIVCVLLNLTTYIEHWLLQKPKSKCWIIQNRTPFLQSIWQHNVIYVASISAHFLIFSLQILLGDFNLLAIIPHHQIFSIIWCIWNITPQFLFLYNELRAASRLNFVTMIQKRQKWYNKTLYMKQTNISIIKNIQKWK